MDPLLQALNDQVGAVVALQLAVLWVAQPGVPLAVLKVAAIEVEVGVLQVREMQALQAVTTVEALTGVAKAAQALQGATGAEVEVQPKVKAGLREGVGQV